MKIYTKTGDKGTTSLYGGTKVSKDNLRIEAYGTIDELNSYIGLIRSYEIDFILVEEFMIIQKDLFNIGAELATPQDKIMLANGTSRLKVRILEDDVTQLENWIDDIDQSLEMMTHFILPGGNQASSHAHVARCICRRAERLITTLSKEEEINPIIIKYINRLSDYLFTAARKIAKDNNHEEIKWIPGE
ncbi:cob(I)yrinic acid a,c-diamide adenosyltransferase [Faecalibacter rhinopitheci]|uniref:Corrinoid adenosyltransferase n=1 Tax=Faecalibacter rhinopitheci TaxID=2779678 RepID=A0A8J7KAC6_9FLAO|nr:cob(I)yrinic acid a,c-diamide adenosyltransferase [Faecalibacter rhinopitheci]MBF0597355.1 cob(I)yrinic acid a,c-diamide adenosyltransferase [Faecalibacter rhinopitheci]MBQ0148377.1 cob(I)yrinic acid a,c-diamide adenosyltransferase [Candidatus Onthonaster equi]